MASCYFRSDTIVAVRVLDFQVRNVTGYFHSAIKTLPRISEKQTPVQFHNYSLTSSSLLRSSPRPISTGQLHASMHFHLRPIHLFFFKWSYFFRMGDLILGLASRLDAFRAYPFPAWLPGCTGGTITGATAAGPSRSSPTEDSSPQISYAHNR